MWLPSFVNILLALGNAPREVFFDRTSERTISNMEVEVAGSKDAGTPAKRKQNNNNNRRRGPAPQNKKPRSNVCFQFAKTGSCDRGEECKFLHESSGETNGANEERSNDNPSNQNRGKANKQPSICFQFAKTGTCDRGEACRFSHEASGEVDGGGMGKQLSAPRNQQGRGKQNKDNNDMKVESINKKEQKNNNNRNQKNRPPAKEEKQDDDEMEETVDAPETQKAEYSAPAGDGAKVHITDQRFEDLPISAESRRAMKEVFKYEFMTVVQAETLPVILKGRDCLAKAKTGTGKTLAFLIPSIEILAQKQPRRDDIGCLVISPTRELAFQISTEAESLTRFHKGISVVTVVGGTTISKDYKALKQNVGILVGTPGRLIDHLKNTEGLADRLSNLSSLILDEADQLLDMGFRPDIERILAFLSKSAGKRQTLLFSATVPQSVSEIARIALRPKYDFVNTVSEEEEQTHLHVEQEVIVVPHADQIHTLASLLFKETSQEPYKVIIFFTTARLTGFMAELFNSTQAQTGFEVLEIHSRKSQAARQKASDKFRKSKHAVLFSSDVSARGMDYPDVTAVIQVGLTEGAQYIHRLGRTARAGKSGHGVLLLSPYEADHMIKRELKDLPIKQVDPPILDSKQNAIIDKALEQVSRQPDLRESGEQAYRAWLGYYNGNLRKCNWDKRQLVEEANQWAKDIGLKQQPKLQKKTVGKMGLKGVPGLLLE